VLLARPPESATGERLHNSIGAAVKNGNFEFRTLQVDKHGNVARCVVAGGSGASTHRSPSSCACPEPASLMRYARSAAAKSWASETAAVTFVTRHAGLRPHSTGHHVTRNATDFFSDQTVDAC